MARIQDVIFNLCAEIRTFSVGQLHEQSVCQNPERAVKQTARSILNRSQFQSFLPFHRCASQNEASSKRSSQPALSSIEGFNRCAHQLRVTFQSFNRFAPFITGISPFQTFQTFNRCAPFKTFQANAGSRRSKVPVVPMVPVHKPKI
jgi:hypothetical protein